MDKITKTAVNTPDFKVMKKREIFNYVKSGLEDLVNSYKQVAQAYVYMIAQYPELKKAVIEECKFVPNTMWVRLEALGNGHLHPQLLFNSTAAGAKLARLSVSEQKQAIEGKVDVVTVKNGQTDILKVSVDEMTLLQVKQVFSFGQLRSPSAQRAWIESEQMQGTKTVTHEPAYKIYRKSIRFREGFELPIREFKRIQDELERKKLL